MILEYSSTPWLFTASLLAGSETAARMYALFSGVSSEKCPSAFLNICKRCPGFSTNVGTTHETGGFGLRDLAATCAI
ncbi:MAG: hypothetical protein C5B45_06025 [Chlamydiae bacterium]|nr:MAG: hypothetical protein C5B45_06025 [Chlamydiota bacterium]